MILSDCNQSGSRGIDSRIRVEMARRRQGLWGIVARLLVENLIGEVRKVNRSAMDRIRGAAVFVNSRPHAESRRCHIDDLAVACPADDNRPSGLG